MGSKGEGERGRERSVVCFFHTRKVNGGGKMIVVYLSKGNVSIGEETSLAEENFRAFEWNSITYRYKICFSCTKMAGHEPRKVFRKVWLHINSPAASCVAQQHVMTPNTENACKTSGTAFAP